MNSTLAETILLLLKSEGWEHDANELLMYENYTNGFESAFKKAKEIDSLVEFINCYLDNKFTIRFLNFIGAENILVAICTKVITNEQMLR